MKKILYIGNFIAAKTNYITSADILTNLLKDETFVVKQTSHKINKIMRLLDMLWQILKYRNQVDLILIDTFSSKNFYFAFFCSQLTRILNIPYINILHGGNLPNRLSKNPFLSRLIFKNANALIAPSNYLKTEFEQKGYQVIYIPNSFAIKEYPYLKRTHFQMKLLWVRAFDKIYHPEMAVEVLNLLLLNFPNSELFMVGPTKDETLKNTQTLAKKYGIENKVTFTGILTKKEWHKLATQCDFFINTTHVDNTPISVLEAMALGLPVVSTNVGGMPYLINDLEDGILVDDSNAKSMANAIEKLIANPEMGMQLAENARKKVEQFDWDIVKYQWIKVLNDV